MVNSENDLPRDFDLLSPGNTTMVTDLTPEFHWDESTDPDLLGSIHSYSVYVSTDDSFVDATPIEVNTNTYTASTDLLEDVLYYWKVFEKDDSFYLISKSGHPTWFAFQSTNFWDGRGLWFCDTDPTPKGYWKWETT